MTVFAERMQVMGNTAAAVRTLFGSMGDPSLIAFSGGAPAKEALPVDLVREITCDIMRLEKRGAEVLQYGSVPGVRELREVVADMLAEKQVQAVADDILITNGGIEGIHLMAQLLLEPGDVVLVENPSFVQVLEVFALFQAQCVGVEMDEEGIILADLEAKMAKYKPKLLYTIPTFQNPSGRTLSAARREQIAKLGSRYDVIILEDDPYCEIRYSGQALPPIKAYDKTGHTVMANSFSKIFSPGCRLGYLLAGPDMIARLTDVKTAMNTHTSNLPQFICAEFFRRGYYPEHKQRICALYRERRDAMLESIDRFFPAVTRHTLPDGGLFTWATLPEGMDTAQLLTEAMSNPAVKVAYVAGAAFFCEEGRGKNCMRLSFGGVPPEKIRTGIERLGTLIQSKL